MPAPRKKRAPPPTHGHICCIINQKSGTAGTSPTQTVAEAFAPHGVVPKVIEIGPGDDIGALTRQALEQGFSTIVSGGGDGTVNAVAAPLVGRADVKFGVLPMGTFNHFAKDLVIPLGLEAAAGVVVKGQTRAIDVGEVNGQIFVNNSSVGAYPAMVRLRVALQKSGLAKPVAAAWAWARIIAQFRKFDVTLTDASGATHQMRSSLIFVGNNRYETSLGQAGTRQALDQGHLWVLVSKAQTRLGMAWGLFSMLWKGNNAADVLVFETTSFSATGRRAAARVAVDGELREMSTPLAYRIRPRALIVIVADAEEGNPR